MIILFIIMYMRSRYYRYSELPKLGLSNGIGLWTQYGSYLTLLVYKNGGKMLRSVF